jgi:hypothetical protein
MSKSVERKSTPKGGKSAKENSTSPMSKFEGQRTKDLKASRRLDGVDLVAHNYVRIPAWEEELELHTDHLVTGTESQKTIMAAIHFESPGVGMAGWSARHHRKQYHGHLVKLPALTGCCPAHAASSRRWALLKGRKKAFYSRQIFSLI